MTTTDPAADPAVTPETPGAVPDAAPGFEQTGPDEGPDPALDAAPAEAESGTEAEPYDFAEHGRRVRAPWPSFAAPRVLTAEALKGWNGALGAIAQATAAALAEIDRDHKAALENVHGRLDGYLQMRTAPRHAAPVTA